MMTQGTVGIRLSFVLLCFIAVLDGTMCVLGLAWRQWLILLPSAFGAASAGVTIGILNRRGSPILVVVLAAVATLVALGELAVVVYFVVIGSRLVAVLAV